MPLQDSLYQEVNSCIREMRCNSNRRIIAFEVSPEITKTGIILNGLVHVPQQRKGLLNKIGALPTVRKRKIPVRSRLKILLRKPPRFAQVKVPFGRLLKEPRIDSELGTDVLFGYYIVCYFTIDKYWYCADPTGYLGYIHKDEIVEKTRKEYVAWLNSLRGRIVKNVKISDFYFPMGSEFICKDKEHIILPSGKKFKLDKKVLFCYKPGENNKINVLLNRARSLIGTSYQWGGNTEKGIDCSGFCQELYLQHNIGLPRDSSQQIEYGRQLGLLGDFSDHLPGDLLFFLGIENSIIHVALSLGGEQFIHALIRHGITISHIDDLDVAGETFRSSYIFSKRIFF